MGLFDFVENLGKTIKKTFNIGDSKTIVNLSNSALAVITDPVKSAASLVGLSKTSFKDLSKKQSEKSTGRILGETFLNTIGVIAPFTSAGKTVLVNVGKALIPKTVLGTAAAGAGLVIGTGYVLSNPTTAIDTTLSLPSKLGAIGTDLGNLTKDGLTYASAVAYIKDHPYLTAATATLALGTLGYAATIVTKIISNFFSKDETQTNVIGGEGTSSTSLPGQTIVNVYQTAPPTADAITGPSQTATPVGSEPKKAVSKKKPKKKKRSKPKKKKKKKKKKKAKKKK